MTSRDIELALQPIAQQLGLRVSVTPTRFGWRIKASLGHEAGFEIDGEVFYNIGRATHATELLQRELDDLQQRVHRELATRMQQTDIRHRQYLLSDEDKHTLDEMYNDACCEQLSKFKRGTPGEACGSQATLDKYAALMEKLFR